VVSEPIPFADFVGALREQLKAARGARDPELPIEVGPVTVEFTLLTRQEGEGKAGIRFWVVDAGVAGKVGRESTQKVTMQLTPLDAAGKPLRVARPSAARGHQSVLGQMAESRRNGGRPLPSLL
jgi:Trypsin-co-occurring domain 2